MKALDKLIDTTVCRWHGSVKQRLENYCVSHIFEEKFDCKSTNKEVPCDRRQCDSVQYFKIKNKGKKCVPDISEKLFLHLTNRYVHLSNKYYWNIVPSNNFQIWCPCQILLGFYGAWHNRLDILMVVINGVDCDHSECLAATREINKVNNIVCYEPNMCVVYKINNVFKLAYRFSFPATLINLPETELEMKCYRFPSIYTINGHSSDVIDDYCGVCDDAFIDFKYADFFRTCFNIPFSSLKENDKKIEITKKIRIRKDDFARYERRFLRMNMQENGDFQEYLEILYDMYK